MHLERVNGQKSGSGAATYLSQLSLLSSISQLRTEAGGELTVSV